jgi:hypothetical protein
MKVPVVGNSVSGEQLIKNMMLPRRERDRDSLPIVIPFIADACRSQGFSRVIDQSNYYTYEYILPDAKINGFFITGYLTRSVSVHRTD